MPKKYDLDAPHTFDGHWWVPGEEAERVGGHLTYDPRDGCTLTLLGSLLTPKTLSAFARMANKDYGLYSRIYGVSVNGEFIVLEGCHTSLFSTTNEAISANMAIVNEGEPFDCPTDVIGLKFEPNNLRHWTGARPLASDFTPVAKHTSGPLITYENIGREAFAAKLDKSKASARIAHNIVLSSDVHKELAEYEAEFQFEFETPRDFMESQGIAGSVDRLLSLFVGTPCYSRWMTVVFTNKCEGHILSRRWGNAKTRVVELPRMHCGLPQIRNEFGAVLDNWVTMSPSLTMTTMLLFACLYKANAFLEVDFGDCAHALDTFAEIDHNQEYIPADAYDKLLSDMLALIVGEPEANYKDLQERANFYLEHMNRPSMRTRVKRLLQSLDADIESNCLTGQSINKFTDYVVYHRNKLAHPGGDGIWKTTNVDELLDYLRRMKLLLAVAILHTVGVPTSVLKASYNDPLRWQWG